MTAITIPPAIAERVLDKRSIVIIGTEDPGFTPRLLMRLGLGEVDWHDRGEVLIAEIDPRRMHRAIAQQAFSTRPEHWKQEGIERRTWTALVEALAAYGASKDDVLALVRLWGEELHVVRCGQRPEEASEALARARAAVRGE